MSHKERNNMCEHKECSWAGGCLVKTYHCDCGWSGKHEKLALKSETEEGDGWKDIREHFCCPECGKVHDALYIGTFTDPMAFMGHIVGKMDKDIDGA